MNPGASTIYRPTWIDPNLSTGWIKLQFSGSGVGVGYQLALYTYGNGTEDLLPLTGETSNRLLLSRYIDNADTSTTYVNLLNTSTSPITVTASFYDPSGNLSGTPSTISIGAT